MIHKITSQCAGIIISYDKHSKRGMMLLSRDGMTMDEISNNCNPCKTEELKESGVSARFHLNRFPPEEQHFFNSETIVGCKVICDSYYKKEGRIGRWVITNMVLAEDRKLTVPDNYISQKLPGSRIRVERRLNRVNQVNDNNLRRPWLIPFKS